MNDKFDPKTHRLGMAYWHPSNDGPLYPSGYIHDGRVYFQNNSQVRDCPFESLIRAPQYDMLPKSTADKYTGVFIDLLNRVRIDILLTGLKDTAGWDSLYLEIENEIEKYEAGQ